MKRDNTKNTLIALIALIVVCGGSFLGVKLLNRDVNVTAPPVIITTTENKLAVTDNVTTTGAVITPATTLPVATTAPSETTKLNQFTTFANPSAGTSTTTTGAATTKPAENTTVPATNNVTVSPMTTTPSTTQQQADSIIQDAAIFSDGFLNFVFNPDDNFYYTISDPWQRQLGFNELYDMGAPFVVMYYDTMRCKFNYDNKDWLVQFWKGQYGFVFIGAEIGVYNKPMDRTTEHYDSASDEDSLFMSMTFYRKGKEILTREYAKYWWCTGFVPGKLDSFADRSELSMRCRITCKDTNMLLAFCDSLKGNGLVFDKDFTTQGNDVFIHWQ